MSAIVASEIKTRYSVVTGSAGNSVAGTAAGSLGKYISQTDWTGGSLNDLFDDISSAENAASTADYRCIFIYNSNTANAMQNTVVFLSAEVSGGASIAIGVDTIAASSLTSSSAQGLLIANETTAPAGVTFTSPTTAGAGIAVGTIGVGQVKAIWIRRTAANTAALSNDGVTFQFNCDTGAL
jgi:hypothetical protein